MTTLAHKYGKHKHKFFTLLSVKLCALILLAIFKAQLLFIPTGIPQSSYAQQPTGINLEINCNSAYGNIYQWSLMAGCDTTNAPNERVEIYSPSGIKILESPKPESGRPLGFGTLSLPLTTPGIFTIKCLVQDESWNNTITTCSSLLKVDCNGTKYEGDDPKAYLDNDNDGHCADLDCDDTNSAINPGTTEKCSDGIDNNCNGQIDCAEPICQQACQQITNKKQYNCDDGTRKSTTQTCETLGQNGYFVQGDTTCQNENQTNDQLNQGGVICLGNGDTSIQWNKSTGFPCPLTYNYDHGFSLLGGDQAQFTLWINNDQKESNNSYINVNNFPYRDSINIKYQIKASNGNKSPIYDQGRICVNQCQNNSNCSSGQICKEGQCITPPTCGTITYPIYNPNHSMTAITTGTSGLCSASSMPIAITHNIINSTEHKRQRQCATGTLLSPLCEVSESRCGDGKTQSPAESCDDANSKDDDGCSNSCKIKDGYTCDTNKQPSFCYLINACDTLKPCGQNTQCTPLGSGQYSCTCSSGYTGNTSVGCTDINECQPINLCGQNTVCTNLTGSFACSCLDGYRQQNPPISLPHSQQTATICQDIDECKEGSYSCNQNATCNNIAGGYECLCNSGYQKVGNVCTNINECTNNTHSCDPNATCKDTIGSFTCTCNPGYDGDGISCKAINPSCEAIGIKAIPNTTHANEPIVLSGQKVDRIKYISVNRGNQSGVIKNPIFPLTYKYKFEGSYEIHLIISHKNLSGEITCPITIKVEPLCGNKIQETKEQCDDGNINDGDGCNKTCQREKIVNLCPEIKDPYAQFNTVAQYESTCEVSNGTACTTRKPMLDTGTQYSPIATTNSCQFNCINTYHRNKKECAKCGDNIIQLGDEICDDGNTEKGDGCDNTCQVEALICKITLKPDNHQIPSSLLIDIEGTSARALDGQEIIIDSTTKIETRNNFFEYRKDIQKAGLYTIKANLKHPYSTGTLSCEANFVAYDTSCNTLTLDPLITSDALVQFDTGKIKCSGVGNANYSIIFTNQQTKTIKTLSGTPAQIKDYLARTFTNQEKIILPKGGYTVNCILINKQQENTSGTPLTKTCKEQTISYCGNGIIDQDTEQCDDGNSNADDGCDKSCQRETLTCDMSITSDKKTVPLTAIVSLQGSSPWGEVTSLIVDEQNKIQIPTLKDQMKYSYEYKNASIYNVTMIMKHPYPDLKTQEYATCQKTIKIALSNPDECKKLTFQTVKTEDKLTITNLQCVGQGGSGYSIQIRKGTQKDQSKLMKTIEGKATTDPGNITGQTIQLPASTYLIACTVGGQGSTIPSDCEQIIAYCGNGVIDTGEKCDDSNTQNDDGCDKNCQREKAICDFSVDPPSTKIRQQIFIDRAKTSPRTINKTLNMDLPNGQSISLNGDETKLNYSYDTIGIHTVQLSIQHPGTKEIITCEQDVAISKEDTDQQGCRENITLLGQDAQVRINEDKQLDRSELEQKIKKLKGSIEQIKVEIVDKKGEEIISQKLNKKQLTQELSKLSLNNIQGYARIAISFLINDELIQIGTSIELDNTKGNVSIPLSCDYCGSIPKILSASDIQTRSNDKSARECDDQNMQVDDGCSPLCQYEKPICEFEVSIPTSNQLPIDIVITLGGSSRAIPQTFDLGNGNTRDKTQLSSSQIHVASYTNAQKYNLMYTLSHPLNSTIQTQCEKPLDLTQDPSKTCINLELTKQTTTQGHALQQILCQGGGPGRYHIIIKDENKETLYTDQQYITQTDHTATFKLGGETEEDNNFILDLDQDYTISCSIDQGNPCIQIIEKNQTPTLTCDGDSKREPGESCDEGKAGNIITQKNSQNLLTDSSYGGWCEYEDGQCTASYCGDGKQGKNGSGAPYQGYEINPDGSKTTQIITINEQCDQGKLNGQPSNAICSNISHGTSPNTIIKLIQSYQEKNTMTSNLLDMIYSRQQAGSISCNYCGLNCLEQKYQGPYCGDSQTDSSSDNPGYPEQCDQGTQGGLYNDLNSIKYCDTQCQQQYCGNSKAENYPGQKTDTQIFEICDVGPLGGEITSPDQVNPFLKKNYNIEALDLNSVKCSQQCIPTFTCEEKIKREQNKQNSSLLNIYTTLPKSRISDTKLSRQKKGTNQSTFINGYGPNYATTLPGPGEYSITTTFTNLFSKQKEECEFKVQVTDQTCQKISDNFVTIDVANQSISFQAIIADIEKEDGKIEQIHVMITPRQQQAGQDIAIFSHKDLNPNNSFTLPARTKQMPINITTSIMYILDSEQISLSNNIIDADRRKIPTLTLYCDYCGDGVIQVNESCDDGYICEQSNTTCDPFNPQCPSSEQCIFNETKGCLAPGTLTQDGQALPACSRPFDSSCRQVSLQATLKYQQEDKQETIKGFQSMEVTCQGDSQGIYELYITPDENNQDISQAILSKTIIGGDTMTRRLSEIELAQLPAGRSYTAICQGQLDIVDGGGFVAQECVTSLNYCGDGLITTTPVDKKKYIGVFTPELCDPLNDQKNTIYEDVECTLQCNYPHRCVNLNRENSQTSSMVYDHKTTSLTIKTICYSSDPQASIDQFQIKVKDSNNNIPTYRITGQVILNNKLSEYHSQIVINNAGSSPYQIECSYQNRANKECLMPMYYCGDGHRDQVGEYGLKEQCDPTANNNQLLDNEICDDQCHKQQVALCKGAVFDIQTVQQDDGIIIKQFSCDTQGSSIVQGKIQSETQSEDFSIFDLDPNKTHIIITQDDIKKTLRKGGSPITISCRALHQDFGTYPACSTQLRYCGDGFIDKKDTEPLEQTAKARTYLPSREMLTSYYEQCDPANFDDPNAQCDQCKIVSKASCESIKIGQRPSVTRKKQSDPPLFTAGQNIQIDCDFKGTGGEATLAITKGLNNTDLTQAIYTQKIDIKDHDGRFTINPTKIIPQILPGTPYTILCLGPQDQATNTKCQQGVSYCGDGVINTTIQNIKYGPYFPRFQTRPAPLETCDIGSQNIVHPQYPQSECMESCIYQGFCSEQTEILPSDINYNEEKNELTIKNHLCTINTLGNTRDQTKLLISITDNKGNSIKQSNQKNGKTFDYEIIKTISDTSNPQLYAITSNISIQQAGGSQYTISCDYQS